MGGVWGVIVRVLHFSHFRDEKSAFFQLGVRALNIFVRGSPLNFELLGLSASAVKLRQRRGRSRAIAPEQ